MIDRRALHSVGLGVVIAAVAAGGCGAAERSPPTQRQHRVTATAAQARPGPLRVRGAPEVATIATGLQIPWEIAFLPDRRALITERPGRVRIMTATRHLLAAPAARVPVSAQGEGGLLGLAIDPLFSSNRFVYVYRTTAAGNQVVRYRLLGSRLVGPVIVARGVPAGTNHDGGRIRFGPDRRLYISTGETRQAGLAQSRASLGGKILRLSPAAYHGRVAQRPQIFSLGHRNPQGFDWQPGTGTLVATEHGPDGNDEINVLRFGGNYGWPIVMGSANRRGLIGPTVLYAETMAPSGATFVHLPGSAWTGDFLVGCLRGEQIRRVRLRGGRAVINQPLFAGRYGRIRTVVEGPDGALYALTNNRDGRGNPQPGDDRVLRIIPPAG
ncbi:MAG TPA: PQQ-dependent sugar dehydrogenase [Solirubrobacteraceae bacterium]|nr:PQQ-dependent sugar dehydrogenase [Solirubrobacteraceae bacterium]